MRFLPFLLILLVSLAGCGGESSGTETRGTPFSADIFWSTRSRELAGPAAADLAKITLVGAGVDGGDATLVAPRPEGIVFAPVHYTSTERAIPGEYLMHVRFETQAGGLVAVIDTRVMLYSNGTLAKPDGSALGLLTYEGKLQSISVDAPTGPVVANTPYQLTATARNTEGQIFALPPTAVMWEMGTGQQFDGILLAPIGDITVRAKVDDLVSEPRTIHVTGEGFDFITLKVHQIAYDASRSLLIGAGENEIYLIDPNNHRVTRTIPLDNPDRLAPSSSWLYVTDEEARTVRMVDLSSGSVFKKFNADPTGHQIPVDIQPTPDVNGSIAVTTRTDDFSYSGTVAVYDVGVRREKFVELDYYASYIHFDGTFRLYGMHNPISHQPLYRMKVDATGVTLLDTAEFLLNGYNTSDFVILGERLFTSAGFVINKNPFSFVGTLFDHGVTSGIAADKKSNRIYMVLEDFGFTGLKAFDPITLQEVWQKPISFGSSLQPGNLVQTGPSSFAFLGAGSVSTGDNLIVSVDIG
ncbi:MAG: YncE family protein [Fimbriimonas sp.]